MHALLGRYPSLPFSIQKRKTIGIRRLWRCTSIQYELPPKVIAVKELDFSKRKNLDERRVNDEIATLKKVKGHPNVVSILAVDKYIESKKNHEHQYCNGILYL